MLRRRGNDASQGPDEVTATSETKASTPKNHRRRSPRQMMTPTMLTANAPAPMYTLNSIEESTGPWYPPTMCCH